MRFGVKAGLTNDSKPDEDEQKMLPKDPYLCRAIPESLRHKRAEDVSVCVEGGYWIRDFIPSQTPIAGKPREWLIGSGGNRNRRTGFCGCSREVDSSARGRVTCWLVGLRQMTLNHRVVGSIPTRCTAYTATTYAVNLLKAFFALSHF